MWEQFAQYGLVGLMIAATYYFIWWAMQQLLGKEGVLRTNAKAIELNAQASEGNAKAIEGLTVVLGQFAKTSEQSNDRLGQLQQAAIVALDEIEAECNSQGLHVRDRCLRIRRILEQKD